MSDDEVALEDAVVGRKTDGAEIEVGKLRQDVGDGAEHPLCRALVANGRFGVYAFQIDVGFKCAHRAAGGVPLRSKKEEREARRSKKHKKERTSRQVSVRSGDTLEEIAKKHGTTVAKLRKANKIKGDRIKPGEKLRLK